MPDIYLSETSLKIGLSLLLLESSNVANKMNDTVKTTRHMNFLRDLEVPNLIF